MAKQIAKREVGLGLNISEFAKGAKTAEELLDKITQGRTISLDTKLNLGDAQAVLQKILDQKTVSIRTALDVKDLMSIMEKSIADFEQRGSNSLARMNRRFLEEFQTGLGSVNFKLDDGTLIGDYQKAIEQANKLNLLNEKQGQIIDQVVTKTRDQTAVIKQESKAIDELNKSVEKQLKLNKMKNDSGKIVPQTYTAVNGQYEIQKGTKGWNLYKTDTKGQLTFITAYETLNELKRDSTLIAEQEAIAQNKLTKTIDTVTTKTKKKTRAKQEEYQKSVEKQRQKTQDAIKEMQAFISENQGLASQYSTNIEFMNKYSELMNQISQSTLNAVNATKQLNEWMGSSGLAKVATLTTEEAKKAFDGINLGEFIESYNIDKEYIPELIEDFKELATLIKNGADKDVAQKIEGISNKIKTLGGNLAEVDDVYREFLDYARRTKIKVNNDWIDPQTWNDEYRNGKRISKGLGTTYKKYFIKDTSKLGTGQYAYSGYPDQFIADLPDRFQFLFPGDHNDGRALEDIINAINIATRAIDTQTVDFTQQNLTGIKQSVAVLADRIENNLLGLGAKNTDQVLSDLSNLLSALSESKNAILHGVFDTKKSPEEQKQLFIDLRSNVRSILDKLNSKTSSINLSEFEAEYSNIFNEEFNSFIERLPEIEHEKNTFIESLSGLPEELYNVESFANIGEKFFKKVQRGAMTSAEAIAALREELSGIALPTEELRQQRDVTPHIGDDMQDSVEEALRIVPKNVKQALDQLRGAIGDPKKLIDLSGVFSEKDLESQISELVKTVNGTDLEFDSVHLFGDTAQIQLSNKALGLHVTQLYQLKEATEDATEATLQFIETSKVSVSGKEQESYISTRQKAMDSAEKWLINAQKKLNTQKRNYQNSQKKIAGDTLLLDADSTTLEANVDATIDGLVSHIQKRIQENLGKVVSEDVKNQITRDLNALENEIKIQQLQKYTNTTMSASEVETARKSIVNMLDTLASKARTNNVFDQISESYNKLRQQLTDNTVEGYIQDNFTDAINQVRVIKSELTKAIALEGEEKPFRQMEESMKSARSEIDTSKKKLNSLLETFGHVKGMDAARKTLDDMTAALELFNEMQDKTDKKAAYDIYDDLSKQFEEQAKAIEEAAKAQQKINDAKYKNAFQSGYQYNNGKTAEDVFTLDSMSDYYKQEEEKAQQFNNNLKSIYSQLISTVKQINNIDVKINDLAIKDGGSGLYSKVLGSAQSQKSALVSQLRSITDEINKLLNIPTGESGIQAFLDTAREKAILTEEEIQKLVDLFSQSENIQFNFTAKLSEQIQPVIEKIASLKQMMKDGIIGKDTDISKSILNIDSTLMSKLGEFKQDPSAFNATQVLKYVDSISKYINVLDQAAQKEQQYFAGKQKYTRGNLVQQMADDAAKSTEEANSAQQKLTAEAQAFAKELGANGAIVTKFIQDANGISKLDFSVLREGTNEIRSFTMAMGSVADGFFFDETTAQKSMSVVQSANNQLSSMLDVLQRLQASGVNMDNSSVTRLIELQNQLSAELAKGPNANQTILSTLTKDAKISAAEVEKLYKQFVQLNNIIADGGVNLGKIDTNKDIREQLTSSITTWAEQNNIAKFSIIDLNEVTGKFKVIAQGTDNTVQTFTGSLSQLGQQAVMQQTNVQQLGSKWEQFKNSLTKTGKQLMTALVGYNVMFKVVSEVRKGINYVKEIDLAMTELKKVTDETEASYRNFINTASNASSQIGSTISDFTEATANFARLGYTMEESADMAKTAIVYKNVADGLDTVEESTESIISTMKAFGIESSDTMSIIDRFNEVGKYIAQVI